MPRRQRHVHIDPCGSYATEYQIVPQAHYFFHPKTLKHLGRFRGQLSARGFISHQRSKAAAITSTFSGGTSIPSTPWRMIWRGPLGQSKLTTNKTRLRIKATAKKFPSLPQPIMVWVALLTDDHR
jgi:hypothetical protein